MGVYVGSGSVEVLSSRVLLRPRDLETSLRFYRDTLGLAIYREYGVGEDRGVVFFLGGGFLEVSGVGPRVPADHRVGLWIQVRDLAETEQDLLARGVIIDRPAARMPWGLDELRARDPDGIPLVFVEVPPDHPLRRRAE